MIIFKEFTISRPELIGKIKTKIYLGIKTSYQLETSTFNIINRQINTKFFTLLAIWCYFDHICWGRNDILKVIWNFYKEVPIDKKVDWWRHLSDTDDVRKTNTHLLYRSVGYYSKEALYPDHTLGWNEFVLLTPTTPFS